mgnify:CR=1 FL=1
MPSGSALVLVVLVLLVCVVSQVHAETAQSVPAALGDENVSSVTSSHLLRGPSVAAATPSRNSSASMTAYYQDAGVEAVYLSGAAYCGKSLQTWSCTPCKSASKTANIQSNAVRVFNSSLATYGYVAYDSKKDRIIVAFRGTTNLQNWITNLKTARTQFLNTGTSVHIGFNSAYMSVRDKVLASVNEFLGAHRSARIMVVGHSLGGALATLCAVDIALTKGIKNIESYTFGSPRVGNQAFADLYKNKIPSGFRVVHWRDIVPSVPPGWFGFNHVQQEVFYNSDSSSFELCDGECSIFASSIPDHLSYINIPISGMCGDAASMVVGSSEAIHAAVDQMYKEAEQQRLSGVSVPE